MSGYNPPFNITNEILTYVSSISEKIGKISAQAILRQNHILEETIELNLYIHH